MRRAWVFVILVCVVGLPIASAGGLLPLRLPLLGIGAEDEVDAAEPASPGLSPPARHDGPGELPSRAAGPFRSPLGEAVERGASVVDDASRLAPVYALSAGALATLVIALLLARAAYRPRRARAKRRTFAAGLEKGRAESAVSTEDALALLGEMPVGKLQLAVQEGLRVRVAVKRGRSEPCELALGYLTGLFEGAWAMDVAIEHTACGGPRRGAVCTYVVAPATQSAGGRAGASTPGSGGAPRRSRGAPPGAA